MDSTSMARAIHLRMRSSPPESRSRSVLMGLSCSSVVLEEVDADVGGDAQAGELEKRAHEVALGGRRRRRPDGYRRGAATADELVPRVGALPVVQRFVVGGAGRAREPTRAIAERGPVLREEVPVLEEVRQPRLVRLDVAIDPLDVAIDRVDLLLNGGRRQGRQDSADVGHAALVEAHARLLFAATAISPARTRPP